MNEEIIKKIIREGEKHGDVLVLTASSEMTNAEFSNRQVISSANGHTDAISIRISKGKKFGHATANDFTRWKECLDNAVSIMKLSKDMGAPITLAYSTKLKNVKGIFSNRLKNLEHGKFIEKGYLINGAIDEKLGAPSVSISKYLDNSTLSNSNGIAFKEKETLFSAIAETNKGEVNAREMHSSRDLFDVKKIGNAASELCLKSLNPKSIQPFKGAILLDYFAVAGLIETVLIPAVSADEIQAKKSFLSNKKGKKIFSSKISVVDDGLLPHGLGSDRFDYEGTPMQKTTVINKGVFQSPLYDIYSAKKENKKSTGNCGGINKIPLINPTNFIISKGDYTNEEIIKTTKEGVLANNVIGLHLINKTTGDCSVGIENGFYVKNGEVKFPLKQTMVSFNLFEELKRIEVIGKTLRQEANVVAPMLRFDKVQIIG